MGGHWDSEMVSDFIGQWLGVTSRLGHLYTVTYLPGLGYTQNTVYYRSLLHSMLGISYYTVGSQLSDGLLDHIDRSL